jgi:hypothetical protein
MPGYLRTALKSLNAYYAGYAVEAAEHLRPVPAPSSPEGRFVLFARGRSGTTLLLSLLSRHPQVACDGEILRRRVFSPRALIRRRAQRARRSVYGFKLLSYQLRSLQTHVRRRRFLEGLVDDGYRLLYLRRRNLLRHALSGLYAEHRRQWHQRSSAASGSEKMTIRRRDLFRWMDGSRRLRRFESRLLQGLPHLSLTYEDDLEDPRLHARTLRRATDWLGLGAISPDTDLERTTPRRLEAFVRNADAVRGWVSRSSYASHLDSADSLRAA